MKEKEVDGSEAEACYASIRTVGACLEEPDVTGGCQNGAEADDDSPLLPDSHLFDLTYHHPHPSLTSFTPLILSLLTPLPLKPGVNLTLTNPTPSFLHTGSVRFLNGQAG